MSHSRGVDNARIIQVIETEALRGDGTEADKCRMVKQYWDFDGNLLAENDPCMKGKVVSHGRAESKRDSGDCKNCTAFSR